MKATLLGASLLLFSTLLDVMVNLTHPVREFPIGVFLWCYGNDWKFVFSAGAVLGVSGALFGTVFRRFRSRRA
jgi:ABC-type enterobactin transport system permease subunit